MYYSAKEDYQPGNAYLIISNIYAEPELPDKENLNYLAYDVMEAIMAGENR